MREFKWDEERYKAEIRPLIRVAANVAYTGCLPMGDVLRLIRQDLRHHYGINRRLEEKREKL